MANYLDDNGLLYLWSKIKAKFVMKVSGKDLSSNDYTDGEKNKLAGIAEGANNYKHPTSSGNKHIPPGGTAGQFLKWSADGTVVWANDNDTKYDPVSKTAAGLAPQLPNETGTTKYLRGDGTWQSPPNTTYSDATQSVHGLMSAPDKKKLDAFGEASTYAKKSDITSMYRYKGSVADASKLPVSGLSIGDVYNIEAEGSYGGPGMNVAWNGEVWDPLGASFSVAAISNATIDTICV